VEGEALDFNDESLQEVYDLSKIRKAYKLGSAPPSKGQSKQSKSRVNGDHVDNGAAMERKELEIAILGAMALRGAT